MPAAQPRSPRVPAFLGRPLALLPRRPALFALQRALNIVFADALQQGEIEFLDERLMAVSVDDIGIGFTLTVRDARIRVLRAREDADLRIAGNAYAFLRLATRTEDSDTLFFRRELRTTGDTDLGLHLKNFLDGLDLESLPLHFLAGPLLRLSTAAAGRIEALREFAKSLMP